MLQELRADGHFESIPIVAVTASAMPGDHERALASGFDGCLIKPLNLLTLRKELACVWPEESNQITAPQFERHGV